MPLLRAPETPSSKLRLACVLVALVGAGAAWIVAAGNPGNMGICGACFLRDLSGALGLFGGPGPKIFRPEVLGIVFGAFLLAVGRGRFTARSGSHAAGRLLLGMGMAFGALVFLGCPFRALQRMGGGDLNAWVGFVGLIGGVGLGVLLERRGYRVGRTAAVPAPVGVLGPLALLAVATLWWRELLPAGPGPGATDAGPAHAPWAIALGVTLVSGAILSATGFCAISGLRALFGGSKRMLVALFCLVLGYGVTTALAGNFSLGFEGQPAAHTEHLWNVLGLGLVGLCGALAGGCPVRLLVMTGEGNGDAFMGVVGLVLGGALAHTLDIASSGAGTTAAGRTVVVLLWIAVALYGFLVRPRLD